MWNVIVRTFLDGLETWIQSLLRSGYSVDVVQKMVIDKMESYFVFDKINVTEISNIVHKIAMQLHELVIPSLF